MMPVPAPATEHPELAVAQPQPLRQQFARPGFPATHALVAANVLVFLAMSVFGPLPALIRSHVWGGIATAPFSPELLVRCGAMENGRILAHGEWWRLVSSIFVHANLVHLVLNAWCLWNLGTFGESLLGRRGLWAVYVLTGAAGMLLSLGWSVLRSEDTLVVGASGAVFGIAGILIVLLSNRKLALPWRELRSLRRLVLFFAVANLVAPQGLAMLPGSMLRLAHVDTGTLAEIDNSAHFGGLLFGILLGLPLFPRMTSGRSSYRARQRMVFLLAALVLALVSYGVYRFAVEGAQVRG